MLLQQNLKAMAILPQLLPTISQATQVFQVIHQRPLITSLRKRRLSSTTMMLALMIFLTSMMISMINLTYQAIQLCQAIHLYQAIQLSQAIHHPKKKASIMIRASLRYLNIQTPMLTVMIMVHFLIAIVVTMKLATVNQVDMGMFHPTALLLHMLNIMLIKKPNKTTEFTEFFSVLMPLTVAILLATEVNMSRELSSTTDQDLLESLDTLLHILINHKPTITDMDV